MKTGSKTLLLSIDEVRDLLGGKISRRSVERWSSAGILPKPIRLGRRIVFRRSDIERFIEDADGDLKKLNRIKRNDA